MPSRSRLAASLSTRIVTTTPLRSGFRLTRSTSPTVTSLYRTCVLLASKPSAVWKWMVAVGPALSQACTTSSNPPITAITGTSQIHDMRRALRGGIVAAAEPDSAIEDISFVYAADPIARQQAPGIAGSMALLFGGSQREYRHPPRDPYGRGPDLRLHH
ncbi:hypothetical protein D3C87_1588980 [compost metagenome]